MMLASSITGSVMTDSFWRVGEVLSSNIPNETAQAVPFEARPQDTTKIERSITVEEYVRNYFSDIPIMVEIAKCESRFRQYDKNGEVIRGEENRLDIGVMQINEYYHIENSKKLGYNIHTLEGNTSYARALFEKYGVKPWNSSSPCWRSTVAYSQYKELALK